MTGPELFAHVTDQYNSTHRRGIVENIICTTRFDLICNQAGKINFTNCQFSGQLSIYADEDNTELTFNHCIFQMDVECNLGGDKPTLKFIHCRLANGLGIYSARNVTLAMGYTEGSGAFEFDSTEFKMCAMNGFKMIGSLDNDHASFIGCTFLESNFRKAELKNACFNQSVFKTDTSFDGAILKYKDTPGGGNFFDAVFEKDAYFNLTDFTQGAFFNGAQFHGVAIFNHCNPRHYECIGEFSACSFRQRVYFDNSSFKLMKYSNVTFTEMASFANIHCIKLDLEKSIFVQSATFLDAEIKDADKETYRIVKNELLKNNNTIEADKYRALELGKLEQSLTFKKSFKEKFVLSLTKLSNAFGTDWLKGVKFTMCSVIIFYTLYVLSLGKIPVTFGWNGWGECWEAINLIGIYFMKFFIVTHDPDFMLKYVPNFFSYLFDAAGRISVSYGIVQTVQAFRKYVK